MCQWVQCEGISEDVLSLAVSGNNIFAGTLYNGIWLSTNNGQNWTQTGLNNQYVISLAVSGNNIFALSWSSVNGVYRSTNNGLNWTLKYTSESQSINSLATTGQYIFVGKGDYQFGGGLVFSTDNGETWYPTSLNFYNGGIGSLGVNDSIVFAHSDFGTWRSTNYGATWSFSGLNNDLVQAFALSGTNVFAGTFTHGVYLSTNNGTNWSQTSLNNKNVLSLIISGTNVFAGTGPAYGGGQGVWFTTNNGQYWKQINQGFINITKVNALLIANGYIFAGTNMSVWRRPLSDFIIGIQPVNNTIPENYYLEQNYPNPFNAMTSIKFKVASASPYPLQRGTPVTLKVFDLIGREVATLVNEKLQPGTYEVTFDAADLPSGIYFYQLRNNEYVATRKLVLIK